MNTLLDVAIGLALVFFLSSMLCSGLLEILSRAFAARGKLMREGLNGLVPDRWLYLRLLNHPMILGLVRDHPVKGSLPSYLPARGFTVALADTLLLHHRVNGALTKPAPLTLDTLRLAVGHAKAIDLQIGRALQPIVDSSPDLETALRRIEEWYDSAMERIGGWYKAYAQKRLFIIGLIVAAVFNIDTLQIATSLTRSADLRAAVAASAAQVASIQPTDSQAGLDPYAGLQQLAETGLPIGYSCLSPDANQKGAAKGRVSRYAECLNASLDMGLSVLSLKLAGWFLTALGICFGAPFWFDALKNMVNLRNAGPKPLQKTAKA